MSQVETGRQNILEQEALQESGRELFQSGIDLLRTKGQQESSFLIFKETVISHRINSAEPPITVWLWSGANLDKARIIRIQIEGLDHVLKLTRKKRKGKESFTAQYHTKGNSRYLNKMGHREVREFLDTINLLKRTVSPI